MSTYPRSRRFRWATGLGAAVTLLGVGIGATAFSGSAARAEDWPQLRGDISRSGVTEEKLVPPLSLLWRHTGSPQALNPSSPSVVGNTAYFASRASTTTGTGGGFVIAVDTKTGAQKWRFPHTTDGLANNSLFSTAPLIEGDMVYIGASDGNLYVLNAQTGQEVRRFRTGGPIESAPTMVNGVLYFGSNDDTFYALDPETGNMAWRQMYRAGDNINSAPVVSGGLIFFTTSDQHLHALNLATGAFRYKFRLASRFLPNAPIIAENTLYIASGRRLHAIQPTSGSLRWARDMSSDIQAAPVAASGVVYIIDRNSANNETRMYALRSNNGKEVWAKPVVLPFPASAAPTIAGDVIYVPTSRNTIFALSREDGKLLWQYTIAPSPWRPGVLPAAVTSVTAPISVSGGALYVLTDDGSLAAFRRDAPDSTGPLTTVEYPLPGTSVSGAPGLPFVATVTDPGSGLDLTSVKMLIDDAPVNVQFDPARSRVYYRTPSTGKLVDPPLSNGRHSVTLIAKDWRGNVQETNWSFVVDNTLQPARSRETPAVPTGVRPPRPGRNNPGNTRPGGARPGNNRPGGRPGRGGATTPPAPPAPRP